MLLECGKPTGKPGIAVPVALGEEGNFTRLEMRSIHEGVDDRGGLLGVAGAVVDDVAVGRRLAEHACAGERPVERCLSRDGDRDRCNRSRGAEVSHHRQDVVLFDQLPHVGRGLGGFVSIVQRNKAQRPAVYPAGAVAFIKGRNDARPHIDAQVGRRSVSAVDMPRTISSRGARSSAWQCWLTSAPRRHMIGINVDRDTRTPRRDLISSFLTYA